MDSDIISQKSRLLLVDDSHSCRLLLSSIVKDLGEVLLASDGEQALLLAREHSQSDFAGYRIATAKWDGCVP